MDIELFDKRYVYLEWSDKLEGKDCILAQTYQNLKDFVNSGNEGRIFKIDKGKEKPFTNHWKECDFCYYDPNYKVKKAWFEGKTIQKCVLNEWEDYTDFPRTSSFFYNIEWDAHEWRIKPTEEIINYTGETSREPTYILNMRKKDKNTFEFSMSEHDSFSPIYANTRKKCQHVLNTVATKFTDKCVVGCKGNSCFNCKPLQDFIKNIKFTRRMTNRELSEWLAKGNGEMKNFGYSLINTSTCHCYADVAENKNVDYDILIRDFGSDEWREPLIEV